MQYVSWDRVGENKSMIEYTNSEIARTIDEHIHSARDREILKRRLIDGICFEPLAEEFEMSVRQIKNVVYRGQECVFARLIKNHSYPQEKA